MKYFFLPALLISCLLNYAFSQDKSIRNNYEKAYADIKEVLDKDIDVTFEQVCFVTEDVFFNHQLEFRKFDDEINRLKIMALEWMKANPLHSYPFSDSVNFQKNYAIYKVLKDTIRFIANDTAIYAHLPFNYDFNDFSGNVDWSNMFVTKLLATHKGNCHSLPYLYKILADELGATCWLALSPNHIYIENRCG